MFYCNYIYMREVSWLVVIMVLVKFVRLQIFECCDYGIVYFLGVDFVVVFGLDVVGVQFLVEDFVYCLFDGVGGGCLVEVVV